MTDRDELLPCPFCGGPACASEGTQGGKPWPYIECESCAASAEPDVWNGRHTLRAPIVDAYLATLPHEKDMRQLCNAFNGLLEIARKLETNLLQSQAGGGETPETDALLLNSCQFHRLAKLNRDNGAIPIRHEIEAVMMVDHARNLERQRNALRTQDGWVPDHIRLVGALRGMCRTEQDRKDVEQFLSQLDNAPQPPEEG